ncbi:FtsX-like permease family protein [Clostridium sp. ATCC 25772]|uniref:ABC transporter permease n=1 Tax=Clostridium sp. ATCC 25772 TaxID=1676991 RepID=UPI000780C7B7|nr:FtsX-like permease family protein [Clostridium sp. ATCC 25772]
MHILFKFMMKNIFEKKLRFVLIVFSIAVATAMTFASMGVSNSYNEMILEKMKAKVGDADLIIYSNDKNKSTFLDRTEIENEITNNKAAYIFDGEGIYKSDNNILKLNIKGCEIEDLNKISSIKLIGSSDEGLSLKDNEVIISNNISKKLNLSVGDNINLKVEGKDITAKVKNIAINKGPFLESAGEMNVIIDNKGLSKLLSREKLITSVLVNVDNKENIEEYKSQYKNNLPNYDIKETINKEDLQNRVKQFTLPFYLMLIIVLIMAGFIIYSAYKVIIIERMAVIGTFRSIGATKCSTNIILIIESLIYGILGGGIGLILGIPILNYLCDSTNVLKSYGVETIVKINNINYIYSFLLAISISFISSIIPIMNSSKISVKEIILGTFSENKRLKLGNLVLALIFLIIPTIYLYKYKFTGVFLVSISCPFLIFIGAALICPYFIKIFSYLFKELYRVFLGNLGAIALDNISSSKALINNVVLLMSTLSAVIAIYVASNSVSGLIITQYEDMNYNFKIQGSKLKYAKDDIYNLDYVNNYMEEIILNGVEVKDKDFDIKRLEGIEEDKFLDFYSNVEIYDDKGGLQDEILKNLQSGNNIIINNILAKKKNIEIGDKIQLKIEDKEIIYNVIGFVKGDYINNLGVALVDKELLKEYISIGYENNVLIKNNNTYDVTSNKLKEDLESYNLTISSKEEELKVDLQENEGLMNSLESFSLMALLIGSLGIMNNLMVSFMYRKKELAVLSSVGMSRVQRGYLLLIEGATIGIIGGTLGALEGIFISNFIEDITYSLDAYLKVEISIKLVVLLGALGAILIMVASIVPIIKSSKLSIVEEIKYE